MQAVGLKPARVPGAVLDPIEQDDPVGVLLGLLADDVGVAGRAAAGLARGDEAEGPLLADQVERVVDWLW